MPDTYRIEERIGEAASEVEAIAKAGGDLKRQIETMVADFVKEHGGDLKSTMDHIHDTICDLVFEAQGPAVRRKYAAENELGQIEDRDLRRSGPVVL